MWDSFPVWVIWVDVAAAVLGLAILGLVALSLYRKIKHFGKTIGGASSTISDLTAQLEVKTPVRPSE